MRGKRGKVVLKINDDQPEDTAASLGWSYSTR